MYEMGEGITARTVGGASSELRSRLLRLDLDLCDAERLDAIRALSELTNTINALQFQLISDLDASRRSTDEAAEMPREERRGVGHLVAWAQRESPHAGQLAVGVATAVVREMPHAYAAMRAGVLSEYRTRLLVTETACLSKEDRAAVDAAVCADLDALEGVGNRRLAGWARRVAYRLDPVSAVRRVAKATSDRYVSLRPAPDCMTYLTALLPVAQGVACLAALRKAAVSSIASGDGRGAGQVMADTLVTRLTGQESAEAVPVAVHLVMPADTFFSQDSQPAQILAHGPIPAALARRLVSAAPAVRSWVRRLYEDSAGHLVSADSRARFFPAGLAELIRIRDDTCATPWCDAPIRHLDHIQPWAEGGRTTLENGQGLCERCNHDKQAREWERSSGPPVGRDAEVREEARARKDEWVSAA
jgi:5-methylcytosine-specific restriction endonuclease McrA